MRSDWGGGCGGGAEVVALLGVLKKERWEKDCEVNVNCRLRLRRLDLNITVSDVGDVKHWSVAS